MSYSFNLIDEGWIPCLLAGGEPEVERRRELGVRDVLLRAPDIQEISDPSPLVTTALHRLLLAIVHRAIDGPRDEDAWKRLWLAGHWDGSVDSYLANVRQRFDLFDVERPFYQVASIGPEYGQPVAKLTHELASGNNVTLFDHTTRADAPTFTAAQAARYVVAHQSYAVGGLVSFEKGLDPKVYKSAPAAPLVKGAVALARGTTLFETLMLNLLKLDSRPVEESGLFAASGDGDKPAWEREEETRVEERSPEGYLDYLTWQSRRIRLFPAHDEAGRLVVRDVAIMKGYVLVGVERCAIETMVAFKENSKATGQQDPHPAIGFRADRALWRDSQSIFQSVDGSEPPRTLRWLHRLERRRALEHRPIVPLDLLGMVTDQASVLLWRHERLPLPLAYLDAENENLKIALRKALDLANGVGTAVHAASRTLATLLLTPEADRKDGRAPAPDDVSNLVASLGMERSYWPRLDIPFRYLLERLPEDKPTEASETAIVEYGNTELPRWTGEVCKAARTSFEAVMAGLDESTRSLKAVVIARRRLEIEMSKAVKVAGIPVAHQEGGAR